MYQFVKYILLVLTASLSLFSCRQKQGDKIKVGFSQAMSTDDWRKQMNSSIKIEASLQPEVDLTIKDANNNVEKQIEDIERFISNKVDVIIVSPIQSQPLTAVVEKSIKAGIPVLVVDRKIEGESYTAYLGADNIEIGRIAARYIVSHSKGSGSIIEITGARGSSPAYERTLGFNQIINENKHFKIVNTIQGDWEKESVKASLKKILLQNPNVEYIFAHNDRMALSAWETAKTLGLEKKIKFIGVDALNTVNGGIELVKNGVLDGTILYPTGGNEALKLALRMYNKESIARNNILNTIVIDKNNAEIIENQMDKVDQQQLVIESQQGAIKVQEREYASQNNLVRLLSFFLVIILTLTIYSIYSTISISKKKKQLERINQTVIDQNNEIQEMAQIAAKSNEVKLNFFTGLSHEFKTPITLIMSYVESLIENDKIKGTTLIDEVKLIHKNSNRLLRLINQLLDFRKIEEQKFTLRASNAVILACVSYIAAVSLGFLLMLSGGTLLSRLIRNRLATGDVFNSENETFPQEERLLENEYSINLPAQYFLKDRLRSSWINIINPFRGLMVLGTPGSGKSYFVIRHVITQHIAKGFSMFVYDFKYDDLSRIVYNTFEKYKHMYKVLPQCYFINFDNIMHRCNPLDPQSMEDITDASESARTILMGLNREWIKRQGDFFVESPINFLSAVIWYLRRYNGGEFCTLPHVIELMQIDYDSLFTILRTDKEIEVLINPFVNAYLNDAMDQLEGQIASAKIAMARLSSPQLYYVLSGNDFTLDINNPEEPKIVCMGNNPQKIQIYGAVLSLYVNRLIKLVNKKGKLKSSLIFDEFPTIYLNNMDSLIATARSNKVSTCLGVQDFSQLRKDYGREQADVILNITGNIISGQVTGDTAKQLSERFGKIMQDRESLSINSSDTSISRSRQLESAVPPSKISSLSSGEFVGMVADDPNCKIELKTFHSSILNDHEALRKEEEDYKEIPPVRKLDNGMIQENFAQIKRDVQEIIYTEMERLLNDPALKHLVVRKKKR